MNSPTSPPGSNAASRARRCSAGWIFRSGGRAPTPRTETPALAAIGCRRSAQFGEARVDHGVDLIFDEAHVDRTFLARQPGDAFRPLRPRLARFTLRANGPGGTGFARLALRAGRTHRSRLAPFTLRASRSDRSLFAGVALRANGTRFADRALRTRRVRIALVALRPQPDLRGPGSPASPLAPGTCRTGNRRSPPVPRPLPPAHRSRRSAPSPRHVRSPSPRHLPIPAATPSRWR